ncbi:hypothetical protein DFQ26_003225 [Actinomortierella ambigua]|nr:hypothetical protein DFQ26_003225 [Actinomortierella ambigua]
MDIVSRLPPEVELQIFRHLDLVEMVTCQLVCRRWYWLAQDQTVWKHIFWRQERPYALPLKDLIEPQPLLLGRSSSSSSSSSSASSVPVESSALTLDYALEMDVDEEEVDIFPTQAYQQQQQQQQQQQYQHDSTRPFVDWRAKCQERTRSERNWAQGNIQSACLLSAHHGGIVRLRIKDHQKLLSADMFGQVALWDLQTLQCETCFEAAVGPIQLMDFSAKRGIMTIVSSSGQVSPSNRVCRIWNLWTKELIHSEISADIACMTMDDRYLILGNESGAIRLIDFATGSTLRSTSIPGQVLQDIYIQNNTMIVVTFNDIRIICLVTLKMLSHAKLPTSNLIFAYCSVFHIRSLILLIENQLIHTEWEPLFKPLEGASTTTSAMDESDDSNSQAPTTTTTGKIPLDYELPPDLSRPPRMYRTSVPPIATITSIAIGGKHPHVLTTNADHPSLENTIRICGKPAPRRPRSPVLRSPVLRRSTSCVSASSEDSSSSSVSSSSSSSSSSSCSTSPSTTPSIDDEGPSAKDRLGQLVTETCSASLPAASSSSSSSEEQGQDQEQEQETGVVLLHSLVPEVSKFLRECGLKPSFMDVDEDIVVVGTDKGEIVVLNMLQ